MNKCRKCGKDIKGDLFSYVAQEDICTGCKLLEAHGINIVKVPDCQHVYESYQCIYCRAGQPVSL